MALIIIDIPNLKVAGSSPAFGYSYTFVDISFCFCKVWLCFWVLDGENFFGGGPLRDVDPGLADRVGVGLGI